MGIGLAVRLFEIHQILDVKVAHIISFRPFCFFTSIIFTNIFRFVSIVLLYGI